MAGMNTDRVHPVSCGIQLFSCGTNKLSCDINFNPSFQRLFFDFLHENKSPNKVKNIFINSARRDLSIGV